MRSLGKTYLMFEHMQKMLDKGIPKEKMLYINFEDDRLEGFTVHDFQTLLDIYFELYPKHANAKDLTFYFDEIQNIKGWDKFIRRLIDKEQMAIYITGSSGKSLSIEIATSMRGRSLKTEVFPLSLEEYLNYQSVKWNNPSPKIRPLIQHHVKKLSQKRGFPETLDLSDALQKRTIQSYVNTAVFPRCNRETSLKKMPTSLNYFSFTAFRISAPP